MDASGFRVGSRQASPTYCRYLLERAVLLQVLAEGTLNTASSLLSVLLYMALFLDEASTYFSFDEGTSGILGTICK